jgi:hypothetical protein
MDVHKQMEQKLNEYRKKHPDLAFRFIDTAPDILRERTQSDGYQVYKEGNSATAGTVGEVRVGDLILAARPRKEEDEERQRQTERTRAQIHAPLNRYYGDIDRLGAGGKYIKPLTPGEVEGDQGKWRGGNR